MIGEGLDSLDAFGVAEGEASIRPRPPLRLSSQQQALHDALSQADRRLADMYMGAIAALRSSENPDALAQAAHSLRELMEKAPEYRDVPTKALHESLKSMVNGLQARWADALKGTPCLQGSVWIGTIDKCLARFLQGLQTFFDRYAEIYPHRVDETAKFLRVLNASDGVLPEVLYKSSSEEWLEIRGYFVGVAHHRVTEATEEEFLQRQDALERFLLDRLRPRTFADLDAIDSIIREGESDAQS